ncbi:diphosphomevalonate decarboxylase [soil metagenome]
MNKATFRVGSNIAFIKYWGVADPAINLPLNNSISMTLAAAHTTTTVAWDTESQLTVDQITLDGQRLDERSAQRLVRHLDRLRAAAGVDHRAQVVSQNNFPMASGIASSASGFAALTIAGCRALDLDLTDAELSALARLGSGSASRSLFGGFVEWERGFDHASSVAHQLYPPDYWLLYDIVAVVSGAAKHLSSEGGHKLAATSPLQNGRIGSLETALPSVRQALAARDLAQLGPILEQDALAMHAVMMTSRPSLLYWQPGTLEILQAVRQWRAEDGLAAYFTIDAGPNVHLMCEAQTVTEVQKRLQALPSVQSIIVSPPGPAPQQLDNHLF